MKPIKYTSDDANTIDLGTKIIYKYPTPTKDFDIGRMVVKGRHPETPGNFIIESVCSFVIYVLDGTGVISAGDEMYNVTARDVVFVPAGSKFAAEGNFEYITMDAPAFYMEQSQEITTD